MEADKKLIEIFLKSINGKYTKFDQLEDLGEAIIELFVNNLEEKEKAKFILSSVREKAERLHDDN